MYINGATVALMSAGFGLFVTVIGLIWKLFRWINHQKEQDEALAGLQQEMETEAQQTATVRHDCATEQRLIVYGLLACLKGLKEQGCNGPVSEAIVKLETHINNKAHSA